jgi:small subunit ribosomal protein S3Ae
MEAHTVFAGHALTTDYVKRMSRKHKSKVDGVFDVLTRDGVLLRVKPEAMAGRRIQHSQKRAIRGIIKDTVAQAAKTHDFDEFIQFMLNGDLGKEAYHHCKTIYPIKRVEVHKSEILELPKVKAVTEAREEAALAATVAADEESPEAEIGEVETEQPPEPTATQESEEDTLDGGEPLASESDQDEETAVDAETDDAADLKEEDAADEISVEKDPDQHNDENEAESEPEKSDDSKD